MGTVSFYFGSNEPNPFGVVVPLRNDQHTLTLPPAHCETPLINTARGLAVNESHTGLDLDKRSRATPALKHVGVFGRFQSLAEMIVHMNFKQGLHDNYTI